MIPAPIRKVLKSGYRLVNRYCPAYGRGAFNHHFVPEDEQQQYAVDGYVTHSFAEGPARLRLNQLLRQMQTSDLKPGFEWHQRYHHTADFRPSAHQYDPVFIDILFESGIPALLKEITGLDLRLLHLQLRNVFPGESYMDWHRDTYIYQDKLTGRLPPVHKIIFYPVAGDSPQAQLQVAPGSHRRMFHDRVSDLRQLRKGRIESVFSSDSEFVLFDTSMYPSVVPQREPAGFLRLIYSFGHDFQAADNDGDVDLFNQYVSRLNNA